MKPEEIIKTLAKFNKTKSENSTISGIQKYKQICLKFGLSETLTRELINTKFPTERVI